jgi:hypothetical protein
MARTLTRREPGIGSAAAEVPEPAWPLGHRNPAHALKAGLAKRPEHIGAASIPTRRPRVSPFNHSLSIKPAGSLRGSSVRGNAVRERYLSESGYEFRFIHNVRPFLELPAPISRWPALGVALSVLLASVAVLAFVLGN